MTSRRRTGDEDHSWTICNCLVSVRGNMEWIQIRMHKGCEATVNELIDRMATAMPTDGTVAVFLASHFGCNHERMIY
jgi:microcompartment protein CcmL/EutN